MDKHINTMISAGVIEECQYQTNWNSPLFLVQKSTPGQYRVVADLRNINLQCMGDPYPLPNLNHVLDKIGGNRYFSTFDFSSSFHQLEYDEHSKPMTSFTYNNVRYWFNRMIMGHKSSSAQFTRMMVKLLMTVPIEQLVYFVDDLLLGSEDVSTHLDFLEIILARFQQTNLKLTPRKCTLMAKEVRFVGLTLNGEGVMINEDRVKAILDLKPPTSRKEVQKVTGFFGYNRKFLGPRYAEMIQPMYNLLTKGHKFDWTPECQQSFEKVKQAIATSTLLCFPDVEDPLQSYYVTLDGSIYGYGATLSQILDGERRVVAYFSRSIPKHKREWGQCKIEFEAMYAALQHWRIYLRGTKFKVITDCLSLLSMSDKLFAKTNPAMQRKLQALADFNFIIEHVSGTQNEVSDFLSRFPHKKKFTDQEVQTEQEKFVPIHGVDIAPIAQDGALTKDDTTMISDEIHGDLIPQPEGPILDEADNSQLVPDGLLPGQEHSVVQFVEIPEKEHTCLCVDIEVKSLVQMNTLVPREDHKVYSLSTEEGEHIHELPDRKMIREAQDIDAILKVVKQWVQLGEKPKSIQANRTPGELLSYWKQFNLLKVEDGILWRKWVYIKNPEENRYLIAVPEKLQEQTMWLFHSNLMSSHPGVALSVERCQRTYYWPGMRSEFKLYIASCVTCGTVKQPRAYLKAPLQHLLFFNFNDAIEIDHIVPSVERRTPRGMRYILTICDCWSNYIVAVAVRSQTAAENVRAILHKWILKHGMPRELICDNHPGFRAQLFEGVMKAFDCKVKNSTPYISRSTGKVEQNNKRLNNALRAAIPHGQEHNWDLYLDYVTYALNALKNRHTGYSPNRLLYGRELNTPLSILVDNDTSVQEAALNSKHSYDSRVYDLHRKTKSILRKVRENAEQDFKYSQKFHDKNLHGPYFKAGDYCFILIQCPSHKFSPKWRGPYRVTKTISSHLCVVQISDTEEKVCNISKMKHYTISKFSPRLNPEATDYAPKSSSTEGSQSQKEDQSSESDSEDEENDGIVYNRQFITMPTDESVSTHQELENGPPIVDRDHESGEEGAALPEVEEIEETRVRSRWEGRGLRAREELRPVERFQAGFNC